MDKPNNNKRQQSFPDNNNHHQQLNNNNTTTSNNNTTNNLLTILLTQSGLDPTGQTPSQQSPYLIERALQHRLAVVDFPTFCATLNDSFENNQLPADVGKTATYIEPLSITDPNLRGAACCTVDGQRWKRGDSKYMFTIQSISKIISYGIALTENRTQTLASVGVEPSGLKFNDLVLKPTSNNYIPHNPLINAGAIKIAELISPQSDSSAKYEYIIQYWTQLQAGTRPTFSNTVFLAEKSTAYRNYALTYFMKEQHSLSPTTDVDRVIGDYLSYCSIESNCELLSIVAATLANHGINPITKQRIFSPSTVRDMLTVMASAGLYDGSGAFMSQVGAPAKSGVSGGCILVIPGVLGMCAFSPRLNQQGNSTWAISFFTHLFQLNSELGLFSASINNKFRPYRVQDLYFSSESEGEEEDHHHQQPTYPTSETSSSSTTTTINSIHIIAMTLFAAFRGDNKRLLQLIGNNIQITQALDYDQRSTLHVAVAGGHVDTIKLLLQLSSSLLLVDQNDILQKRDRFGHTALEDAILLQHFSRTSNYQEIISLLQVGINPHRDESSSQSTTGTSIPPPLKPVSRRQSFEMIGLNRLSSIPPTIINQETTFLPLAITGNPNIKPTYNDLNRLLQENGIISPVLVVSSLNNNNNNNDNDPIDFKSILSSPTKTSDNIILRTIKGQLIIPCFSRFKTIFEDTCKQAMNRENNTINIGAAKYSPVLVNLIHQHYNLFEASITSIDGQQTSFNSNNNNNNHPTISLQSIFKPFAYAFAIQKLGIDVVNQYCGVEPSGKAFHHIGLMESGIPFNPMINSGGLVICALLLPYEEEFYEFWLKLVMGSSSSTHQPIILQDILRAERNHVDRHFATTLLMREQHTLPNNLNNNNNNFNSDNTNHLTQIQQIINLYTKLCSISCTTEQISSAASILANFGTCPITHTKLLDRDIVRHVLRVMFSCGCNEESGEFMATVGLPGKTGVSGLTLLVIPNLAGVAIYSPQVNNCGNSIYGLEFCRLFSTRCFLHSFDRAPQNHVQFENGLTIDNMHELTLFDFIEAACRDDVWTIKDLLSRGMDVNASDYDHRTALHVALSESSIQCIKLLIQHPGINLDMKDRWGITPRMKIIELGYESLIQQE
jgi:glutaminase